MCSIHPHRLVTIQNGALLEPLKQKQKKNQAKSAVVFLKVKFVLTPKHYRYRSHSNEQVNSVINLNTAIFY
jgi:hypothetical protein